MNKHAFTSCQTCHKKANTSNSNNNGVYLENGSEESESSAITSFFIGSIEVDCRTTSISSPARNRVTFASNPPSSINAVILNHHIFTNDGWKQASKLTHPSLKLHISTNGEDYRKFGIKEPRITPTYIDVIVDSGAQSCLWSRQDFLQCGFSMKDLIPVQHEMKAANTESIAIDGAIFVRLSGRSRNGRKAEAAVMVYISPEAKSFFLSKDAMIQLCIVSHDFPQIGAADNHVPSCHAIGTNDVHSVPPNHKLAECGCPVREAPPGKPDILPFSCKPENRNKMKEWLLDRYSSSTFNKCPHQPLPTMDGPPIKIHIDPNAKPIAFRKPAPIPLHWQEQVEQEIYRDVELGVLERVPHGEPTDWCFRMVVTRKDDGGPRRTVDLSPLNKFCEREAHASRSPFNLARSVPVASCKTVFDAWNGYHSVPIREEDRHLTTFTTPWGLFRYKRAPQGFLSSGDGYNRRFDDIASHITRMERCVDDCLLHDLNTEVEKHWWRAIEFVELCGKSGIVLNPEKLQFSEPTVDFAGFRISEDSVEPLPKYIEAIRNFPTPKNITDVRSWFGLVNQVSHYSQLRDMMEPFRTFLSPRVKFQWDGKLNEIFEDSKARIVEAIKEGVQIFDISRRTCLRTDWSKCGIAYFLAQKHCDCTCTSYGCCEDGWKVTLAGSRFLTSAEKNYAPVEGEALAVAWALEQTRFFTMGCTDLLVIVDHKPLIKIFGDRRLDEINNPRLFRLKHHTLMWKFQIEYQRGHRNPFADAMSRYPNQHAELASISMMDGYDADGLFVSSLSSEAENFFAVTWERVQMASRKDEIISNLVRHIKCGFPKSKKEMPEDIQNFWDVRDNLYVHGDVVLYKDRIVIPGQLRSRIVENLHSAHQGVTSMFSRAQSTVYWPGMCTDIEDARKNCRTCHRNAPSQAKLPPTAPELPTTPFQMVYADYFELMKKHYLVVGDRLSGWTEVIKVKPGSENSGSKGLCCAMRQVFVTFGVPEEVTSDGGPEFISHETSDFFRCWGIHHRLSSAYFPQSNGRAEVAVKMTKRLLEDNVGKDGNINTDRVACGLLQQRNTPDRDCKLRPAEVLFGRRLRDSMPQLDKSVMIFESSQIHNQWHKAWSAKEEAIRSRLVHSCEKLESGSKELPRLHIGDHVFIQNQDKGSQRPNKWDKQGKVIMAKGNDQYLVKVNGTGRLTLRNRRFLRKFQLRSPIVEDDAIQPIHEEKPINTELPSIHVPLVHKAVMLNDDMPNTGCEASNPTVNEVPSTPPDSPDVSPVCPEERDVSPHKGIEEGHRRWTSKRDIEEGHLGGTSKQDIEDGHRRGTSKEDIEEGHRRSTRVCTPREVYDASTGKSAPPKS